MKYWKDSMKVCAVVAVIMFAKWLVSLPQKNADMVAAPAPAAVNRFATPPVQATQPVSPPATAAHFATPPTASTREAGIVYTPTTLEEETEDTASQEQVLETAAQLEQRF